MVRTFHLGTPHKNTAEILVQKDACPALASLKEASIWMPARTTVSWR